MTMRGFGVGSSTIGIVNVRDLRTISIGFSIIVSIVLTGLADGGGLALTELMFDVISVKGEPCRCACGVSIDGCDGLGAGVACTFWDSCGRASCGVADRNLAAGLGVEETFALEAGRAFGVD
jgi:hypothetical protein